MQSVQKLGGLGALIAAGTCVVGLAMFVTLLTDFASATTTATTVEFIAANQLALHLWNTTIMMVFGIALVPVVLAIGDRLREAHSPLARVASVFGLISSGVIISTAMITNVASATVSDLHGTDPEMAPTVWASIDAVTNGLEAGNHVFAGLWALGVSIVALRERLFARWVNHLGAVCAVARLVSAASAPEEFGTMFDLGLVVWLTAVGIKLLEDDGRSAKPPASSRFESSRAL